MKSRLYWRSATRSLARGGQRMALSIVCVAVGVLAVVALQLVSAMVTTGLTGDVRALNGGDLVARSTPGAPFTSSQLTAVEHLKTVGDITAVTAVYRDFLVQIVGRQTVTHVEVRAVDPAHFPPREGSGLVLSPRESEVLRLLADGWSNAAIAERLIISEYTVKNHVSNILGKLHLADRTQAAIYAWRTGFVDR